jgi:hypothetical protein
MKKISFYDLMNQKKYVSHLFFLLISLVMPLIAGLRGKFDNYDYISAFILIFLQLEVFIFLGNKLFANLNFDRNPVEITRIVIIRFAVFMTGCLVAAMILYIIMLYVFTLIRGQAISNVLPDFVNKGFHDWFISTIKGLSGGALIFIILLWQSSLRREQKLREENLIFQNETLKNQINPHFLFNSLNTLSSLIGSRPETAEKFLNKLSAIYRYILENSRKDRVPLTTELNFISDYFELHRIRDDDKIELTIDAGNASEYSIIPVSLQILIENCIKHNMATRENRLRISITVENDFIVVQNNLQKMGTQLKSTGTGLKNLAERVRLITGKTLAVDESNSFFTVKVPLLK